MIQCIYVGTRGDERLHNGSPILLDCPMQSGCAIALSLVGIAVGLKRFLHCGQVAAFDRLQQRSAAWVGTFQQATKNQKRGGNIEKFAHWFVSPVRVRPKAPGYSRCCHPGSRFGRPALSSMVRRRLDMGMSSLNTM